MIYIRSTAVQVTFGLSPSSLWLSPEVMATCDLMETCGCLWFEHWSWCESSTSRRVAPTRHLTRSTATTHGPARPAETHEELHLSWWFTELKYVSSLFRPHPQWAADQCYKTVNMLYNCVSFSLYLSFSSVTSSPPSHSVTQNKAQSTQ